MMSRTLLIATLLLAAATPARADEKLALDDKFATVGVDEVVQLKSRNPHLKNRPPHFLRVVYRPNSATEVAKVVGRFDIAGKITWTPEAPGLTVLEAIVETGKDAKGQVEYRTVTKRRVATCYAQTPVSGLVVMILAGILLFGGAAVSLWMALRTTPDP